ncbi:MAG TPA: hypothetical protein VFV52_10695 [Bacilli bacterium]|nr:hypothetical protein [Bacilli bacterium]
MNIKWTKSLLLTTSLMMLSASVSYAACQLYPSTYNFNKTVGSVTMQGSSTTWPVVGYDGKEYMYYQATSTQTAGAYTADSVEVWAYGTDQCLEVYQSGSRSCTTYSTSGPTYNVKYWVPNNSPVSAVVTKLLGECIPGTSTISRYHNYVAQGNHQFTYSGGQYSGWSMKY